MFLRKEVLKAQLKWQLVPQDVGAENRSRPSASTPTDSPEPPSNQTPSSLESTDQTEPMKESELKQSKTLTRDPKCAICRGIVGDGEKLIMSCCKKKIHNDCYDDRLHAKSQGRPVPACQVCSARRRIEQMLLAQEKEQDTDEEQDTVEEQRKVEANSTVKGKSKLSWIESISSER